MTTSIHGLRFHGPEIDQAAKDQILMSIAMTVGSFMAHMGERLSEAQRQMRRELEERQET